MDSIGNPDHDIDHTMEPAFGNAVQESSDSGSIGLCNLEDEQRLNTPTPSDIANYGGPSTFYEPQRMDGSTDLPALPGRAHGRSFVTLPDVFNGKKENYQKF
jgi:hypothetical protein